MTVPNIDTFEHDIAEEIKKKEASMGDIASASGTLENIPASTLSTGLTKGKILLVGLAIVFLCASISGATYFFYYQERVPRTTPTAPVVVTPKNITEELTALSPTLARGTLPLVTQIESTPFGTLLTVTGYSTLFIFMIENEETIAKEMLAGTYSLDASTTPSFVFTDVTESNQNMRKLTIGSSTLVYAFIDENHLVFASSTQNVVTLRNVILK